MLSNVPFPEMPSQSHQSSTQRQTSRSSALPAKPIKKRCAADDKVTAGSFKLSEDRSAEADISGRPDLEQIQHQSGCSTHGSVPGAGLGVMDLNDCSDMDTRQLWLDRSFIPSGLIDATVAEGFQELVRFCISHFCYEGTWIKATDAKRVSNDVWRLWAGEEIYVLGLTGEVLGRELREDWALFVSDGSDINDAIRNQDRYGFPAGIAKGFTGDRAVARRVVVSSCVAER